MHFLLCGLVDSPVSRQDPFEIVTQEAAHRASLLRPRIPACAARGPQLPTFGRPGQVISGEQISVLVEQYHMAAGMPWSWDGDEISIQRHVVLTANDFLHPESRAAIRCMHYAGTTEPPGELCVIGDVVLVCQEHCRDAAERGDLSDQVCVVAR